MLTWPWVLSSPTTSIPNSPPVDIKKTKAEGTPKSTSVQESEVVEQLHYAKPGRPAKDQVADRVSYQLCAYLTASTSLYPEQLHCEALFVLASNELDVEELCDEEILSTYKAQSIPERGFRILKDPMFLASTSYLKKVERVMALLMVMTLCLLVYAALEYRIRTTLVSGD